MLAFALAAGVAHKLGWPREKALAVGVAAGAFGMVPDVDVVYAPAGLVGNLSPEAFWSTANVVHRTVTHSLLIGAVAATAVGLWALACRRDGGGRDGQHRLAPFAGAITLMGGLVAVAALATGGLGAVVMAVFGLAALLVAYAAVRLGLGARAVAAAALVGFLSHPFGDLFTGEPPAFLYPLNVPFIAERVALHPDPTLHLLGAFGAELAVAWFAVLVYLRIDGDRLNAHLAGPARLGLGYVVLAPLLPAPTLEVSYQFVFTVLAVGVVAAVAAHQRRPRRTAVTGLAAATLASLAYTAVYLTTGLPTPV